MCVPQQARSRRSVAGKDIMLDPRAGIRKAGAMPPLMALLREVVEVRSLIWLFRSLTCIHVLQGQAAVCPGPLPHA